MAALHTADFEELPEPETFPLVENRALPVRPPALRFAAPADTL